MELDTGWVTRGRHRIRLRSIKGFPTAGMRAMAEVARLAVDNNMSARARIVEIVCSQEKCYEITVGTTMPEDKLCAPQIETAIAAVLGVRGAMEQSTDLRLVWESRSKPEPQKFPPAR